MCQQGSRSICRRIHTLSCYGTLIPFPQPKSYQTASFVQVGILIHPLSKPPSPISSQHDNHYSIITRNGRILGISSPSSIEIYIIILDIHCIQSASLTVTVYTDYQKAVRVANDPNLLHSMCREDNLPLF